MGFLQDKVALVTGGGSGIGRAVVDLFVSEGAKVGVLEVSAEKVSELNRRFSPNDLVASHGDAASIEDNQRAVARVVEEFGPLTTLVCAVGVFDYFTELPNLPAGNVGLAFDQLFAINVKSNLLGVIAARDELIRNCGDIVLTVSNAGFYAGGGGPLYASSKFAVRGLVTELAYELAPRVRVNGVAPGGTITELRGIPALESQGRRLMDEPGIGSLIESVNPLGIVAQPADHAWAYAYLASKERARAVTGTIIHSDGGIGVRGMTRMAGLSEAEYACEP